MKVVIYKHNDGVAILRPTEESLRIATIEQIALKDVPSGCTFKIVEDSEIPTDRSDREAWTVDESDLTDGIGGESDEFPEEILSKLKELDSND